MKYSLKRFLKNLKFLLKHDLDKKDKDLKVDILKSVEDIYYYEILDKEKEKHRYMLDVLNYDKTIDLLLNQPKSFCRFGDGEIEIMMGNNIPFQKYNEELKNIMLKILESNNENLYVGINYNYFHSIDNFNETSKNFYLLYAKKYRDFLLKHCNKNRKYIAAGFTQLYMGLSNFNYNIYFEKARLLFKNRELVIFAGDGVLNKLKYDIFELAKSKEYIKAPNINAFSEFDNLLNKALEYPPDKKTFVFILGPCAKALVYKLAEKGYMAWDIGHLAKDYDAYMRGIDKTEKNIVEFFKPD